MLFFHVFEGQTWTNDKIIIALRSELPLSYEFFSVEKIIYLTLQLKDKQSLSIERISAAKENVTVAQFGY